MIAHRKQGPVLPTLVMNISPDPATDKLRKRRSSRTAGLTTTKDTAPSTLWFRPGGDDQHTLHDWARFIQILIQPNVPDRTPMSPISPTSPTFINPFQPRPREASDATSQRRPSSGHLNSRNTFQYKVPVQMQPQNDRSRHGDSPSLRSKRSDLSSQTSSLNPSQLGFHNHNLNSVPPPDLPSPATTVGDYQGEFIEGWTSAQGRASTLSSPVRGSVRGARDSVSSQVPHSSVQSPVDSSSPPGPRETILDRAFQLRCIPGSEQEVPGEEKLSSLARFDALMREVDEKRIEREAAEAQSRAGASTGGLKSAWDLDDDSDDSDDDADADGKDDGAGDSETDSEDEPVGTLERDANGRFIMPPTAQRALDFVSGRPDVQRLRAPSMRSPLNYNQETLMALSSNSGSSQMRPQTGYSKNRPAIAQRTHSQPQLATLVAERIAAVSLTGDTTNPALLDPAAPAATRTTDDGAPAAPPLRRAATEKRASISSTKRLSFTEFTKRLSSTSSLLLVQTNNSNGSSRGSTEIEFSAPHGLSGRTMGVRTSQLLAPHLAAMDDKERENWEKRCGWRGSVGVFGTEGGFL